MYRIADLDSQSAGAPSQVGDLWPLGVFLEPHTPYVGKLINII